MAGLSFNNFLGRLSFILFCFTGFSAHAQLNPFAFWKVSAISCPSGGYAYSGNCYYMGTAGNNCYTTCSSLGGCLRAATQTLANSKPSCAAAITALGGSYSGYAGGSNSYAYACALNSGTYYYDTGNITCSATSSGAQRLCSCGSGGTSQAGIATVNGYNYVLGAAAASCDTACTSYGGCNLTGTQYAAGSTTVCNQILQAVDIAFSGGAGGSTAVGCGYQSSGSYAYLGTSAVTCAATLAGTQRICACVNP